MPRLRNPIWLQVCTEQQPQLLLLWFKFLLSISNNMLVTPLRFTNQLFLLQGVLLIMRMNMLSLLMPRYTIHSLWLRQYLLSTKP